MTSRKRWSSDRRPRGAAALAACLLLVGLAGPLEAAGRRHAPRHEHSTDTPELAELTSTGTGRGLKGRASFYGPGFTGRRTTTGERFDPRLFTAASNHFALGELVSVQRLDNSRCAIVKINDRMGGRGRRILDVSRGVAEYLGMISDGVVLVRAASLKGHARTQAGCRSAFVSEEDCPECNGAPAIADPRLPSLNRAEPAIP